MNAHKGHVTDQGIFGFLDHELLKLINLGMINLKMISISSFSRSACWYCCYMLAKLFSVSWMYILPIMALHSFLFFFFFLVFDLPAMMPTGKIYLLYYYSLILSSDRELRLRFLPCLAFICLFTYLFIMFCRFLKPVVADVAVVAKCHLSALYTHEKGRLFAQLVDLLQFYEGFEIDDHVGMQLSDDDVLLAHYSHLQAFQLLAFKQVPKVRVQV